MHISKKNNYLFNNVSTLSGVGKKLSTYLKNKKIEKINDLLWNLPYTYTDRSDLVTLDKLSIGKIQTTKVKVLKYNFPRIRNLPNRIRCEDDKGKIDLIFFNSREGYIKKILPLDEWVVVSGKITFFRNQYQITNPSYVEKLDRIDYVKKIIPKYSLTEGLTEKKYRKIIEQVLESLNDVDEWHDKKIIKKMRFSSWKESIISIHNKDNDDYHDSLHYKRLAYDEILSNLLVLSENRKKIKKIKKKPKIYQKLFAEKIIKSLPFKLTKSQLLVMDQINEDLESNKRMFRILQGDVGSGKTIVSLLSASNVIESGYQCALMAPTAILAKQHYELALKIFKGTGVKINFLTGKTINQDRKKILNDLENNKINFIIGTHSLFQKKILFKNLGFIIIDEQHKFGVKQRIDLAKKGGDECDVLLMSATPIPRTLILATYGDMDVSRITEKPYTRKVIKTLSKPEEKLYEIWPFIEKNMEARIQIFWVCPLINESKIFNYSSAKKKYEEINKRFPGRVALLHGSIEKDDKEKILNDFLNKKIDILVTTTVIEVGIDFPNANLIIIENSNKFGLAQLHQLRGRVGRGKIQGTCILLFKGKLSKNAIKRIKILKSTDDGFLIADEDLKLRGFGDILGFQQSGIKNFRLADPIHHEELFKLAENNIKDIDKQNISYDKFSFLLRLFDKAEVINEID
jgi:ATP-dependent DNA helicase RecG